MVPTDEARITIHIFEVGIWSDEVIDRAILPIRPPGNEELQACQTLTPLIYRPALLANHSLPERRGFFTRSAVLQKSSQSPSSRRNSGDRPTFAPGRHTALPRSRLAH